MIQALLELFTTEEKATAMLASPIIEFIFMTLFMLFIITLILHFTLFIKIRNIRHYVKTTDRLDVEPLQTYQQQFKERQAKEAIRVDTFIQEKISSWKMFHLPVVNIIKIVNMTISVFILLGVLGTFIGLTISLGNIETTGDQLVENVAAVLAGIDVAFYTSIVGMGFSLMMTIIVKVFNTEYILTDFMLHMESLLEGQEQYGNRQMMDVSEKIHEAIVEFKTANEQSLQGIVQAFAGFKDYTSNLQQAANDLAAFNEDLTENLTTFQTLFHAMKDVTDDITEGTTALNQNFATLFSYFKKTDQRNERMMTVFEKTYEKIEKVQHAQLENFTIFNTSVDELKDFTKHIVTEQKTMHDGLQEMINEVHQLVDMIESQKQTFTDLLGDSFQTKIIDITKQLENFANHFQAIGHNIGTLPEALEVINETHTAHKKLLQDRFHELKAFNESFNQHIHEHANESANFHQQMKEAATTHQQIAENNEQLIQALNRSIEEVKQTFTKRDHQLDTNVAMVKETLANYVTSLEGTLGQKLENLLRTVDNQMYQTNDKVNREWTEMRQIANEINQNNARTNQQLLQDLTREIQTMNRRLEAFLANEVNQRQIGPNDNE